MAFHCRHQVHVLGEVRLVLLVLPEHKAEEALGSAASSSKIHSKIGQTLQLERYFIGPLGASSTCNAVNVSDER